MIFIVSHGEYECKEITLVTECIDKAINNFLYYKSPFISLDIPNSIEVWDEDKLLVNYGGLMSDLVNKMEKEKITFQELKNDLLKKLEERN